MPIHAECKISAGVKVFDVSAMQHDDKYHELEMELPETDFPDDISIEQMKALAMDFYTVMTQIVLGIDPDEQVATTHHLSYEIFLHDQVTHVDIL